MEHKLSSPWVISLGLVLVSSLAVDSNRYLSSSQEDSIVVKINDVRTRGTSDVSNMNALVWDDMLADDAQVFTNKCTLEYEAGATTGANGQNVGEFTAEDDFDSKLPMQFEIWYGEGADYDLTSNTCSPGQSCRHYLQLMWATTTKVGCAVSKCDSASHNYYITCYFEEAYDPNEAPYQTGGTPCTACENDEHSFWCFNDLCAVKELCPADSPDCTCDHPGCDACGSLDQEACACVCQPGSQGAFCADIDECTENTDECTERTTCSNVQCGYNCTCINDGYEKTSDGLDCIDPSQGISAGLHSSMWTHVLLVSMTFILTGIARTYI